MDATTLLLKREEIQRRMEARRLEWSSEDHSITSRLLPWVLSTGLGLVSGLKTQQTSYGWLGSAAAAVVLPAIMRFTRRKTERDGFVTRLMRTVFPSRNL